MKRRLIISAFLLVCTFSAFTQTDIEGKNKPFKLFAGDLPEAADTEEPMSLSVEDAVELAKKNNISIARGQITLDAALRSKNHSWNSISPSASLGASSTLPLNALSDNDSNYTSASGISASVSLTLTANLFTSMQKAKIDYEAGKLTFEDAVKSVELKVRETFYELLYLKEKITLQERNLEIAKTQYTNNLAKYNQGRLSEIDVLSAEVEYKSKIPEVENARTNYRNNLAYFKQLIGVAIERKIELAGSLDDMVNLNEVTVSVKDLNPSSVKSLEYKLESAKNTLLEKRFSAYAPSLNASFNWSDASWYTGYEGNAPAASKTANIKLTASIPLDGFLPWSSKSDGVENAKDSVKDLQLQIEEEKKNLIRTVISNLRSIKQTQESIKYRQANVKLAQKNYDMTTEAYNRGTKDLLTLQNASTSLMNAQVTLKSETLTLIKSILELENTVGLSFGRLGKES